MIPDVVFTIIDDDTPAVEIAGAVVSNALAVDEPIGVAPLGTVLLVRLLTEPRDEVTVVITDDNDDTDILPGRLTFNSGNWNARQVVNYAVNADDDTANDMATITFAVTQAGTSPDEYEGITVDPIAVTITDPDKSEAVLSTNALSVTEESTGTYTVRLSHQPASGDTLTVAIAITGPAGATDVTVDDNSLDFTSTNWNVPQTVTVTGVADANLLPEAFTLTHTVSGTRAATTTPTVMVTRVDNDVANIDISQSAVSVDENSSGTFTLELTQQPSADVTLTVTTLGSGHDLTVTSGASCTGAGSSATFTFTTSTWNAAQTVRVCAAHDHDAADDMSDLRVSVSSTDAGYNALANRTVGVTVVDDDTEGITISESTLSISETDGGVATAMYNVSLSAAPTGGNVTVTIAAADNTDVTAVPTVLTFRPSDWTGVDVAAPTVMKSVEVRVADDADANEDTATITHTRGGVAYGTTPTLPSIDVTITDTDTHGVTITADDPFEFNEGGSKTFTLVLDSQPTANVAVLILDDTGDDVRFDDTDIVFPIGSWNVPQTVRVSATRDDDGSDDMATVTFDVIGGDYETNAVTIDPLEVTVKDLDVRDVILEVGGVEDPTDPSFSIGEGFGTVDYRMKLATRPVNSDGTDGEATVTVTTTNTAELVIVDPSTASNVATYVVTFTADNWDDFQTVTVGGASGGWGHVPRYGDDHAYRGGC